MHGHGPRTRTSSNHPPARTNSMGSLSSKLQLPPTVLGITLDNATKSYYRSQLTDELLPEITRRLATELMTTVRPPPAHHDGLDPNPDPASFLLTIFAPVFEPKNGILLSNIKLLIFATEHLRRIIIFLNLLADLKQRVVRQWRRDWAAVRSRAQGGAKSKKSKHNINVSHGSEKKLAELMGRLSDDLHTDDLRAVGEQQRSLLRELREEKSELKEKLSSHNKWRGCWSAIYKTAFFTVLAGSVALASAAAPTPAMTAATVVSTAMKAAEPWFDALWDGRMAALEGDKDVIKAMVRDVSAQLHQLDRIRAHVDELKDAVDSLIVRGSFFDLNMMEEYNILAFEKVDKDIELLHKMADDFQADMKKAAAHFVRMIADET